MPSLFFCPFFSYPCSFSTVRSYSAFVSPSVSSSPSFLIPLPSSLFVSWCGLTAEPRSCAPPFYLRIVRKTIPYSSFVAFFFLSHCLFAPFPSHVYSHISCWLFSVPIIFSLLSMKITHLQPYSNSTPGPCLQQIPYPLSPDNDYYRLMRICIFVRIHAIYMWVFAAISSRIWNRRRDLLELVARKDVLSQPSHRKMQDALFASIFGTILK